MEEIQREVLKFIRGGGEGKEQVEDRRFFHTNLTEILELYPKGELICLHLRDGTLRQIIPESDGNYCNVSDGTSYSKENLIYDIAQRRILLGELLTTIEKNKAYRLDVDLRTGAAIGNMVVNRTIETTIYRKKGISSIRRIVDERKHGSK